MALTDGEAAGEVEVEHLVGISHAGHNIPQRVPFRGDGADLLLQLPLNGLEGVLPRLQLARGDLGDHLVVGVAELPLQIDVPVIIQRHHGRAAGVVDDLAEGGPAVGELHLVPVDFQQPSVENQLAVQRFFHQFHGPCLPRVFLHTQLSYHNMQKIGSQKPEFLRGLTIARREGKMRGLRRNDRCTMN